jgi:hypothetical protein
MDKCPVCKAGLKDSNVCPRCHAGLSILMAVAAAARNHWFAAREAYGRKNVDDMLFHARQAFSKRQTTETSRMLACAALLAGDPNLALREWRRVSRNLFRNE